MKLLRKYKALSKKTIAIVLGITLITAALGYTYIKANRSNNSETELVSREREYMVKRGDITAGTNGSGILKFEQVLQNFKEAVMIDEVFVKEGQRVSKGDKLLSISEEFINDKLKELNEKLEQAVETLNSSKKNKQSAILTQNKAWTDKIEGSKSQYESQRSSIVSNINNLTYKLDSINNKISEVKKQIEELLKNQEENTAKIEELKLSESELVAEKETTESELKSVEGSLISLDNARSKELDAEKKELYTNNEINALSNGGLDDSINNAQREIDKINEEISKVNKLNEESILYAEVDGVILSLNCTPGAMTTMEVPAVIIGESDKVLAEIAISQNDITKIEEGQAVYISVSAFQDEKFEGKVKYINLKPSTQGNSTNYSVTVEVDKKDFKLLDGMTTSAQFIVKEVKDVLMLSNKAITIKDGKQIVNVRQEDGTLKEVDIATGFSDGKNSEIISGLSEGDTVIVGGH